MASRRRRWGGGGGVVGHGVSQGQIPSRVCLLRESERDPLHWRCTTNKQNTLLPCLLMVVVWVFDYLCLSHVVKLDSGRTRVEDQTPTNIIEQECCRPKLLMESIDERECNYKDAVYSNVCINLSEFEICLDTPET